MLGGGAGGLEQAALDYAEALQGAGRPVLTLVAPGAWVSGRLQAAGLPWRALPGTRAWNPLALWTLRRLARRQGAQAVICHGNRALGLALRALSGRIPVLAVAHNHSLRRFPRADACLAVSRALLESLRQAGIAEDRLHLVPNATRLPPEASPAPPRQPPRIGSLGRMVPKKGFSELVAALRLLQERGLDMRAVIGGDGPERAALAAQAAPLGDRLALPGWIEDRATFFAGIDLFVLPSREEPFGIVLLEAMAHGLPCIATATEGPRDIWEALDPEALVPREDAAALADAIAALLADPAAARRRAAAGRRHVAAHYTLPALAARLQAVLPQPGARARSSVAPISSSSPSP